MLLALISAVLHPSSDAVRDFAGFVISGDRENFSVGVNLMQLLLAAQEGEWDELAAVIHSFQQMTWPSNSARARSSPRPSASPWAAARRFACTPPAANPTLKPTWALSRPASASSPPAAARKRCCSAPLMPPPRSLRPIRATPRRALPNPAKSPRRSSALSKPSPWPKSPPQPPTRARWACFRTPIASP